MTTVISTSEAETIEIAKKLAKKLKLPAIILLYGDLGSGKTVFTRGLGVAMGIPQKQIKSPTYTFVREHRTSKIHFYHFDFYRIEDLDDLMAQDLKEIFAQKNSFIVIEWAERLKKILRLPVNAIEIRIKYLDDSKREITILNEPD